MSQALPRVVAVKLETRPRKAFVWLAGSDELARMAEVQKDKPEMTIAYHFMRKFNTESLKTKPALWAATWTMHAAKSESEPPQVEWVPE